MGDVRSILAKNRVATLATINPDGSPWATPVHLFADDTALYWFSRDSHQHSGNIANDSRVSAALWSNTEGTFGAYVSGNALQLSEVETAEKMTLVTDALGDIPPYFQGTFAFKLELGRLDPSKSSEKRWYFYS